MNDSFNMRPLRALALLMLAPAGFSASAIAAPSPLPSGAAAYLAIPEHADNGEEVERLQPGDRIKIVVLGEPELTSDNYRLDSTGYLQMPLVGDIIAGGQTPRELRTEIARRLAARYIKQPQVAVTVLERPRSTFTVEGDVENPGVFEANTRTTLLTALAQAKSPGKTAKLSEIMVFRVINGRRAGGRFNLKDIRSGRAPDPQILAGDTVVVANSAAKSAWRDFLAATPLFNLFTFF